MATTTMSMALPLLVVQIGTTVTTVTVFARSTASWQFKDRKIWPGCLYEEGVSFPKGRNNKAGYGSGITMLNLLGWYKLFYLL